MKCVHVLQHSGAALAHQAAVALGQPDRVVGVRELHHLRHAPRLEALHARHDAALAGSMIHDVHSSRCW